MFWIIRSLPESSGSLFLWAVTIWSKGDAGLELPTQQVSAAVAVVIVMARRRFRSGGRNQLPR